MDQKFFGSRFINSLEKKKKKFIASLVGTKLIFNGVRLHFVIVSTSQWKPFCLATQLYAQNNMPGWQFPKYYDVCVQAPYTASLIAMLCCYYSFH